MARMIPDVDLEMIENNGERQFYEAARQIAAGYTVFYSYKFQMQGLGDTAPGAGEIDFVIAHPAQGYVAVEVKQGEVAYFNGVWLEYKNGGYVR